MASMADPMASYGIPGARLLAGEMQHVKNGLVTCSTWPLPRCCECMRKLRCWSFFILLHLVSVDDVWCSGLSMLVLSWVGCFTLAWNEVAGLDIIIAVADSLRRTREYAGCQSQSCRACWTAASVLRSVWKDALNFRQFVSVHWNGQKCGFAFLSLLQNLVSSM